jgi:hypothetical protein
VLGLFHPSSAVRISSALRVQRDLLKSPLPHQMDLQNEGGKEPASIGFQLSSYDLFAAGSFLRLNTWNTASKAETVIISATSTSAASPVGGFSHADLRKIAGIAFGDFDLSIRASAVSQMWTMLSGDLHLLHTADIGWVLAITSSALADFQELCPFAESTHTNVSFCIKKLQALSDAECRLLLDFAKFIQFLFTSFAGLRSKALFGIPAPGHRNGSNYATPSVNVFLRFIIAANLMRRSNTTASDAIQKVAPVCAQVLCLLVCCVEAWQCIPHEISSSNNSIALLHSFVSVGNSNAQSSVHGVSHIPCVLSCVVEQFMFPTSVQALEVNEYSNNNPKVLGKNLRQVADSTQSFQAKKIRQYVKLVKLQWKVPSLAAPKYPCADILASMVSECSLPSVDRIQVATVTKLFGLLMSAQNHAQLRETTSSSLCIFQANSSLLSVFVSLRISLVTALSKIITVSLIVFIIMLGVHKFIAFL